MSEQAITFVEGFSERDYFEDRNGVLFGKSDGFSMGFMARAFPSVFDSPPLLLGSFGCLANNSVLEGAPLAGWVWISGQFGLASLDWYDGLGGSAGVTPEDGLIVLFVPPAAVGPVSCGVFVHDGAAGHLYVNGTLVMSADGAFNPEVPPAVTTIGAFADEGIAAEAGDKPGQGISGIGYTDAVLTPQQVADHWDACDQGGHFADGPFDYVWDARRGLPQIDEGTTVWTDELRGAELHRVTINGERSLRTSSARPRFR